MFGSGQSRDLPELSADSLENETTPKPGWRNESGWLELIGTGIGMTVVAIFVMRLLHPDSDDLSDFLWLGVAYTFIIGVMVIRTTTRAVKTAHIINRTIVLIMGAFLGSMAGLTYSPLLAVACGVFVFLCGWSVGRLGRFLVAKMFSLRK